MIENKKIKIALLSNFTVTNLSQEFKVQLEKYHIQSSYYEANYNQVYQELINTNSTLKQFNPDFIFILVTPDFLSRDLNLEPNSKIIKNHRFKIDEIIDLLNKGLNNLSGTIIVSNLKTEIFSPFGINSDKIPYSFNDLISEFNTKLKKSFLNDSRLRVFDLASFFQRYGQDNITDEKLRYLGDLIISPQYYQELCQELCAYITSNTSRFKKCIVLDLDNTLWGGVVGEDGFNGIALDDKAPGNIYMDFQRHLLSLHKRGVILAVNSKNNMEDAMEVINKHPRMVLRENNFAAIRINWNDKVANMKEIASEINIGTDSLIFIDDDPLNRMMVKKMMPEVEVIDLSEDPAQYIKALKNIRDIDPPQLTEEDFLKGEMYYKDRQRKEFRTSFSDLNGFLKELDIQVIIEPINDFSLSRVSQLTQKTNQFNLTTKRYSQEEINKLREDKDYMIYTVSVSDKFGDNGLTGVIILRLDNMMVEIDSFLISCRIIGRGVEKAMLKFIANLAKKKGIKKIIGKFYETKKNKITASFYPDNQFVAMDANTFAMTNFDKLEKVKYLKLIIREKE